MPPRALTALSVFALPALAGCGELSSTEASAEAPIYGGRVEDEGTLVARSTLALFSGADADTGYALVDGSATLIAPNIAVGAAHTCLKFRPRFASFGPQMPVAEPYGSFADARRYPRVRPVVRCVAHPGYDDTAASREDHASRPVHDIAVFFLAGTPAGVAPVKLLAPDAELPREITLAGFGAYEDQFDRWWEGMKPYALRRVDTFVGEEYPASYQFRDGPIQGKGSCQGDSGGSVYVRITAATPELVLAGIPVSGPACDEGIGYNTDIRDHLGWLESTAGQTLRVARSLP